MAPKELTTAEWEEQIANPDPRVKWAMDVFDQEGENFTGMVGRAYSTVGFGLFPVTSNLMRNALNRMPLRTNAFAAICCMPIAAFVGIKYQGWLTKRLTEEKAVMQHYILTHPEHFPEPKKVKYLDKIEPWVAVRV